MSELQTLSDKVAYLLEAKESVEYDVRFKARAEK